MRKIPIEKDAKEAIKCRYLGTSFAKFAKVNNLKYKELMDLVRKLNGTGRKSYTYKLHGDG